MYMVGFYCHEAMKCCYITVDGILYIQLVIGFIACRMLSHFMYFVRNDEIKMFNQCDLAPGAHLSTGHPWIKSTGARSSSDQVIAHRSIAPGFVAPAAP